jgi:hypothetical protein
MRRAPGSSLLLAILVAVHVGHASPITEDRHRLASESFRQAQAAFGRREYAAAAAAFEQAAKFETHPSPLLDAEEAWELAGEPVHAAEDCDLVLALPGVEPRYAAEAERRLRTLTTRISTLAVQGPRTTTVRLDGGAEVVLPARRRLSPGRHELAIVDRKSTRVRTETLELVPGEVRTIDAADGVPDPAASADTQPLDGAPAPESPGTAAAQPPPAAPSAPAPRDGGGATGGASGAPAAAHRPYVPVGSWVALGASAVSAGVAIGFGEATLSAKHAYAVLPAQSTADAFQRDRIVTNAAWGAALVAAVAAVVVWLVTPADAGAKRAPPVGAVYPPP